MNRWFVLPALALWLGFAPFGEAKILRQPASICHLAAPEQIEIGHPIVLQVWAVRTTPCDRLDIRVTPELANFTYRVSAQRSFNTEAGCIDLYPGCTLATLSFMPRQPGHYVFLADRFQPSADSPETLRLKLKGDKPRSLAEVDVHAPWR